MKKGRDKHSISLYCKHVTITNDDSRVVRMMLQIVASPTIVILMTLKAPASVILEDSRLKVSVLLPENILIVQTSLIIIT